jgi:hypothetical protein
LEKETLSLPDIVEVMGPRPFEMKESLKEYLSELKERAEADAQLTAEEKEAEKQKLSELAEATKFDPNAEEEPADEPKEDGAAETPSSSKDGDKKE